MDEQLIYDYMRAVVREVGKTDKHRANNLRNEMEEFAIICRDVNEVPLNTDKADGEINLFTATRAVNALIEQTKGTDAKKAKAYETAKKRFSYKTTTTGAKGKQKQQITKDIQKHIDKQSTYAQQRLLELAQKSEIPQEELGTLWKTPTRKSNLNLISPRKKGRSDFQSQSPSLNLFKGGGLWKTTGKKRKRDAIEPPQSSDDDDDDNDEDDDDGGDDSGTYELGETIFVDNPRKKAGLKAKHRMEMEALMALKMSESETTTGSSSASFTSSNAQPRQSTLDFTIDRYKTLHPSTNVVNAIDYKKYEESIAQHRGDRGTHSGLIFDEDEVAAGCEPLKLSKFDMDNRHKEYFIDLNAIKSHHDEHGGCKFNTHNNIPMHVESTTLNCPLCTVLNTVNPAPGTVMNKIITNIDKNIGNGDLYTIARETAEIYETEYRAIYSQPPFNEDLPYLHAFMVYRHYVWHFRPAQVTLFDELKDIEDSVKHSKACIRQIQNSTKLHEKHKHELILKYKKQLSQDRRDTLSLLNTGRQSDNMLRSRSSIRTETQTIGYFFQKAQYTDNY